MNLNMILVMIEASVLERVVLAEQGQVWIEGRARIIDSVAPGVCPDASVVEHGAQGISAFLRALAVAPSWMPVAGGVWFIGGLLLRVYYFPILFEGALDPGPSILQRTGIPNTLGQMIGKYWGSLI